MRDSITMREFKRTESQKTIQSCSVRHSSGLEKSNYDLACIFADARLEYISKLLYFINGCNSYNKSFRQ